MRIGSITALVMLLCTLNSFGQVVPFKCAQISKAKDCNSAQQIRPQGKIFFRCTPEGTGNKLEIKDKGPNSIYFFEKEHNMIWLVFKIPRDGLLTFRIIPKDSTYDYDFLLFKANAQSFCGSVNKGLKPVRSNISRNDPSTRSITGLAISAKQPFVRSGPGAQFSSALDVKKGDKYYLAIDNVYGGASPFFLEFSQSILAKISGTILNDEEKPIKAEITIEDAASGDLLGQTESDSISGKFTIEVLVDAANKQARYNLTAYSDKHFFSEIQLTTEDILSPETKPLSVVLPKLKKGKRMQMTNINFHGNSPVALPGSEPTFKRLKKLMLKNPSLSILIEGHTNGCGKGVGFSQTLSENRAKTVNDFLLKNKVNDARLQTQGFNCSRMLYPAMKTAEQQRLNRRVEIVVLSY